MRRIALLAVMSAILPAAAFAESAPKGAVGSLDAEFVRADVNQDGYLSHAEVEARMARMRAGAGQVDTVHAKRLADLFIARADADKDGRVSAAESRALLNTVFTAYDLNHDGKLDPREAAQARAAAQGQRRAVTKPPR